jgi:hypothetical protein
MRVLRAREVGHIFCHLLRGLLNSESAGSALVHILFYGRFHNELLTTKFDTSTTEPHVMFAGYRVIYRNQLESWYIQLPQSGGPHGRHSGRTCRARCQTWRVTIWLSKRLVLFCNFTIRIVKSIGDDSGIGRPKTSLAPKPRRGRYA